MKKYYACIDPESKHFNKFGILKKGKIVFDDKSKVDYDKNKFVRLTKTKINWSYES